MTVQTPSGRERFRLRLSPMQFSDGNKSVLEDAEALFTPIDLKTAPDIIGFTEVQTADNVEDILMRVGHEAGYQMLNPDRSGSLFAVHPMHHVASWEYRHVITAKVGMPAGNYGARGVLSCDIVTPAGNQIGVCTIHSLTAFRLGRGGSQGREALNTGLWEALTDEVTKRKRGSSVAFYLGDFNINARADRGDDPNAPYSILKRAGLNTIFDELDQWPSDGAQIDWIGRYAGDKRVNAVHMTRGPNRNSDHRLLDGIYDIDPLVLGPMPSQHQCPLCGLVHVGSIS
jgi:hypothetical protein